MNITIYPTPLSGSVIAPPSKSITQRAFICAALANGTSTIYNSLLADDTIHTKNILISLGVKFTFGKDSLQITPPKQFIRNNSLLDCGESGATLRFFIPILTKLQNGCTLKGTKRLIERLHADDLKSIGLNFMKTPNTINIFSSQIAPKLTMNDSRTTQLISGVLMMAPLMNERVEITILSNRIDPYISLTLSIMKTFGIETIIEMGEKQYTITVPENQTYIATTLTIEGDYSTSANFFVMGALGKKVIVQSLWKESMQGDSKIISILKSMNVDVEIGKNMVKVGGSLPIAKNIDLTSIPDLGPILIGLASLSQGTTVFTGIQRLYLKESDRVRSTLQVLIELGAKIEQKDQTIIVQGQEYLMGGVSVDSWNDHRIIFMICALSSKFISPVKILNAQAVNKSYPNFWKDLRLLGAKLQEDPS